MTRDWLKEQIKSYLHDAGVDNHLDTWIDLGAARISNILQCQEMEAELTRNTGGDNWIAIPDTVKHIIGVQWQNRMGVFANLRSVPRHEAVYYKRDGSPAVYYVENRNIYPAPFHDGEYKAQVIQAVTIPAGTGTVDALTSYPFLFLGAALAEAYDWKQNPDMLARYEGKWTTEANEITSRYLSERVGDTPAMRAM